jgi:hypothetical protein
MKNILKITTCTVLAFFSLNSFANYPQGNYTLVNNAGDIVLNKLGGYVSPVNAFTYTMPVVPVGETAVGTVTPNSSSSKMQIIYYLENNPNHLCTIEIDFISDGQGGGTYQTRNISQMGMSCSLGSDCNAISASPYSCTITMKT